MASHATFRHRYLCNMYIDRHVENKLYRKAFVFLDLSKINTNGRKNDYGDISVDAFVRRAECLFAGYLETQMDNQ